jgi:hypothetical protein
MVRKHQKEALIVLNDICCVAADVFGEITADWAAKLSSVMNGCYPKNIANGVQMGLVFYALPRKKYI